VSVMILFPSPTPISWSTTTTTHNTHIDHIGLQTYEFADRFFKETPCLFPTVK
jgi:hypothetical protein